MKTLLYIGPNGNQYWQVGGAGWEATTRPSSGSVWAVTDLAEESIAEVPLPRIFGRDRTAYIARQLASRFPDTPYRTALPTAVSGKLLDRLGAQRLRLLGVDATVRIESALADLKTPLAGLWSTSMLMALQGRHRSLPSELFLVMPGNGRLRIVFLRDRQPVLFRLAAGGDRPAEQAAEIGRTLRHLENTRAVERSGRRYAVLALGPSSGLGGALAEHRLDLIDPPPHWPAASHPDGLFALFDLVLTSPPGQLVPAARRSDYLGQRLGRAAIGGATLALALTLWAISGEVQSARQAQNQRDQALSELRQHDADLAQTEHAISRFGVAPDLLRRAVTLDAQEVASAPGIPAAMTQVAAIVSRNASHRLCRFDWRLLSDGETACARNEAAHVSQASVFEPTVTPNAVARRVELRLDLRPASGTTALDRTRALAEFSRNLAQLPGAALLQDPAQSLATQPLSSSDPGEPQTATWCLTLTDPPNARATAAVPPP